MKEMSNQLNQYVIAAIILLGLVSSAFALENKTNEPLTFDSFLSNSNQNSLLKKTQEFDLMKFQSGNLLTDSLKKNSEYPKPDFSEMEKWYEIIKYQYGDMAAGDYNLYVLFKVKAPKPRPSSFYVTFYDQDGAELPYGTTAFGGDMTMITGEVGKIGKLSAGTPTEKAMEHVASVKVFRFKN